jgi:hypothetical protein
MNDKRDAMAGSTEAHPEERRQNESIPAFSAFQCYLKLGEGRSLKATSQQLDKNYALIRRWSKLHHWRERIWQWDISRQRESAMYSRQARKTSMRRLLQDAEQFQKLSKVKLLSLIKRNPVTGEAELDESITPQIAIRIYQLGLQTQQIVVPAQAEENESETPMLANLADNELMKLIELAKERSQMETEDDQEKTSE